MESCSSRIKQLTKRRSLSWVLALIYLNKVKFLSGDHLKIPVWRACLGVADQNYGQSDSLEEDLGASQWQEVELRSCSRAGIQHCSERPSAWYIYDTRWRSPLVDQVWWQLLQFAVTDFSMQLLLTWATVAGCPDGQQLRFVYLMLVNDSPQKVCMYTNMTCHWHMKEEFILAKMP